MAAVIEKLNLQGLIQVILASLLGRHCAVTPSSFLIDFFYLFLFLDFLGAAL
jgi:hypothetical protein